MVDIKKILKAEENEFSIPLQKTVVLENAKIQSRENNLPNIKLISIKDFQTKLYSIKSIEKPISKIIIP